MSENKSTMDELKSTIANDDVPLGKKAPGAPFAVVGLSYLVILGASVLAIGLAIWLFS